MSINCQFCPHEATLAPTTDDFQTVTCPNCGTYKISGTLAATVANLLNNNDLGISRHEISGYIRECTDRGIELPIFTTTNLSAISESGFLAKSARDKPGKVMKHISRLTTYFGEPVEIPIVLFAIGYCRNADELRALLKALKTEGLLEARQETSGGGYYSTTISGIEFTNSITESDRGSSKVFVAMWFAAEMQEPYRQHIQRAIKDCEYEPLIISDKEYLNDVTDEILLEIKQSRFVVADLTGSRGGVYFEAGFAYGLGKPVIWTCRKDWFSKEHIHFDVEHFPFIIWETGDELYEKIKNRIRAVF